jgi:regulator of protease activity HflC (stomatin/prohibitin superfamily)
MFNLGYFKALPTEYVLRYGSGRLRREGQGLAFFYWKHSTQIVAVPTASMDTGFVFNEATSTFQAVTIQGQLTYRIVNPKQAAGILNFTIDPNTRRYLSDDPDRLAQRIVNIIQMETRSVLADLTLEETLSRFESIALTVQRRMKEGALLDSLGVELMSVYFQSAKPTPEVAKALEANYRETLMRKADEAIYARRAAAVEEERKIKQNEMATQINLEERKRALIDLQGENGRVKAENRGQAVEIEAGYRAKAREMEVAVFRTLEPRVVLALALEEMGRNASKVGNLTITSEMLSSLLNNGHCND